MITKERLEELIEQGATIYELYMNKNIIEIQLKNDWYVMRDGLYEAKLGKHAFRSWWISNLYETKEDAEFVKEFGCIEKINYLQLPTYQQIENLIEQKKKFGLNHSDRVLARIITNDSIYYFKLCKDLDVFTFQLKQNYIGDDLCEQIRDKFPIVLGKATKDNYIKACRKAKELFLCLGEKK